MKREGLTSNLLRIFLAGFIVAFTLGWFPGLVRASSSTHPFDISTNYNLAQTKATDALPITSQPVASSATGTWEVTDTIQLSGTERPLQIAVGGGKAYISRNPGHLTVLDLFSNLTQPPIIRLGRNVARGGNIITMIRASTASPTKGRTER